MDEAHSTPSTAHEVVPSCQRQVYCGRGTVDYDTLREIRENPWERRGENGRTQPRRREESVENERGRQYSKFTQEVHERKR